MGATALRETGIKIIGQVPWGGHICQFYETKKDLLDIVVPYFKAGLENNEYCIWAIDETLTIQEAFSALRKAVTDFDQYYSTGCIEIFSHGDWYFKDGQFKMDHAITSIFDRMHTALRRKFDGLRLNGNEGWLDRKTWKNFVAYEAALNDVLDHKRLVVACTYDLKKCDAADVMDIAAVHESAIARRHGRWEVLEVPTLRKSKEQIKAEMQALERSVVERTKALAELNEKLGYLTDALKNSEDQLASTLEVAGLSAWELDLQTNTVLTKKDLGLSGFPETGDVWALEKYLALLSPEDQATAKQGIAEISKTGKFEMKVQVKLDDGSIHWLENKGRLMKNGGKKSYIIGTTKDITDQMELERRKAELITTISHELKTPVTSIKALTQLLELKFSKSSDDVTHGMLKRMVNQLNRLTLLIRDIVEISRLQFGKLPLQKTDFSLSDLASDIADELEHKVTGHRILVSRAEPVYVHTDRERVKQVLTHLIGNAIKFSPGKDLVTVSVTPGEKEVSCCVTDFGIGIPKVKQKHIFEKFYRVTEEKNYEFQGIGLGLYLCSEIIKRLHGKIWFTSKKGEGSTFCFSLPATNELTDRSTDQAT